MASVSKNSQGKLIRRKPRLGANQFLYFKNNGVAGNFGNYLAIVIVLQRKWKLREAKDK